MVNKSLMEQKLIGWNPSMKCRISKGWGLAQNYYYGLNPDTRSKKYFIRQVWTKSSIKAHINMGLGIWDDR